MIQELTPTFATLNIENLVQDGLWPTLYDGEECNYGDGKSHTTHSPIDGSPLARFRHCDHTALSNLLERNQHQFEHWRQIPAPQRGELVRRIGELARERKEALAKLITYEVGKIESEALGEVQEMIDICDFAVGLSRQLYGLTIASERPIHRMMEQWHPLGPTGIITAFNFPMAVWAWNATLALVCGNTLVWKPSEQAPLCALACQQLVVDACHSLPDLPLRLSAVVLGDHEIGAAMAADHRLRLISATGSCAMGRTVAQTVAARLGRYLLELGGNNAMIVTPSADIPLALRAIVFSAVGTCGQRCTTLRRLIVHESIQETLATGLINAYQSLEIGDPRQHQTLVGPLISEQAWRAMEDALHAATQQGGEVLYGGNRITTDLPGGVYVEPALVQIPADAPIVKRETFTPILYISSYRNLDESILMNNQVEQGLSSAIFTKDLQEAERFLGPAGSDCGLANVNIGTSGAEIGGAFGGEKATGGGRESGSDSWKNYMRRTTNTINYGDALPLAQGINFDI